MYLTGSSATEMLIPLNSGAYEARDLIANAQLCINLYQEINPKETSSPVTMTHYPTPGKTRLVRPSVAARGRGLYTDITGTLWAVIGNTIYKVDTNWALTSIGTIPAGNTTVAMQDNEEVVFLVNGAAGTGYTWEVGTGDNFAQISDDDFLGSTTVDYLSTYLLFTQPGSPSFYTSLSAETEFDPLYFAAVTGQSTDLQGVAVYHGAVWLIGVYGSEIWYLTGDTDILPFQRMPDMVLHHGCAAARSIAKQSGVDDKTGGVFWLAQNKEGSVYTVQAQGYAVHKVSTTAIDDEFRRYVALYGVSDAVGYCYQQDGHAFYVLNFPAADATWVYDTTTTLWHQRTYLDRNGVRHRDRIQCAATAYTKTVGLDWETGTLYEFNLDAYSDDDPWSDDNEKYGVERVRSFPHLVHELNRVIYARFIADMDPGNVEGISLQHPPWISLRWSDDRGHSWGNPVRQTLGTTGQFNTSLLWTRLGMARDRVFELSWSVDASTALNGAYVEPIALRS